MELMASRVQGKTEQKDWREVPFGSLYAAPSRNGVYKTEGFHGRGFRIVNMGEMFGYDFISDQEMNLVSLTVSELAISALRDGDLLFGRRSVVEAGAGKCSLVVCPTSPLTFESSIIRVRLNAEAVVPRFYYYFFKSPAGRECIRSIVSGTNVKGIRGSELFDVVVPLPDRSEQRAIAAALSDVDALLGALDQLIAKKRDMKQAAMQQLLTGQTRLPGFSGKWETKRLDEAFTIFAGTSKSAHVVGGGTYWVVDMGSVSTTGRLLVSKRTNYYGDFLNEGDLIMPKDDIGGGHIIGKVAYIDSDNQYVLGDHVYCLRANSGDPRYLALAINSYPVNLTLRRKVIGSAQLGLARKSVAEQEILFPRLAEQTALADVLTEMETELVALEQRRDKTRLLKQGMMQELLTGRTRLV